MKRNDKTQRGRSLLLAAGLLALFAAALGAAFFMEQGDASGKKARVYQDGQMIREIDLSLMEEAYEFTVSCEGGSNRVQVTRQGVCVLFSDCADQTCVRQGMLRGGLTPIVCLPHRLVIQLEERGAGEGVDGVAG